MSGLERETKTDLGVVRINNEAVSSIASIAAKEVKGVVRMGGSIATSLYEIFWRSDISRGVKVNVINENEIKLDIWIVVEYGVNIPQIAAAVQDNVKRSIESMTGLNILDINVNVQSVSRQNT